MEIKILAHDAMAFAIYKVTCSLAHFAGSSLTQKITIMMLVPA